MHTSSDDNEGVGPSSPSYDVQNERETFGWEEEEDFEEVLKEMLSIHRNYNTSSTRSTGGADEDLELTILQQESSIPLFRGATSTKLSTILLLLNIQARHNISNVAMDDIMRPSQSTL